MLRYFFYSAFRPFPIFIHLSVQNSLVSRDPVTSSVWLFRPSRWTPRSSLSFQCFPWWPLCLPELQLPFLAVPTPFQAPVWLMCGFSFAPLHIPTSPPLQVSPFPQARPKLRDCSLSQADALRRVHGSLPAAAPPEHEDPQFSFCFTFPALELEFPPPARRAAGFPSTRCGAASQGGF